MKTFFKHMKDAMKDTEGLMAAITSTSPGDGDRGRRTIVHEILDLKLPLHDKSFRRVFEDVTSQYRDFTPAKANHLDILDVNVLEQLPCLTATIMEGLRLSPGIATRMARIAPDRDLFYKEWRIPAGTPVGMTTILMHMDEKIYPDPHSFDPKRWMEGNERKNAEKAYAPFSRGTRICLGMHLAWAELYLTLAALVRQFDFRFEGAKAEDFECDSDQFVVGTKGKGLLEAHVSIYGE
ncbi:putative Trichodiene oxygenase [Hypoxylon cercidicola]|nr:putative Trichodiene oxygenase [Hypoxylon cercidicola]